MISRFSAEIATATVTAGLGLAAVVGSLEFGIGWGVGRAGAGTFPFYIGLLVMAASVATLAQTIVGRRRCRPSSLTACRPGGWQRSSARWSLFVICLAVPRPLRGDALSISPSSCGCRADIVSSSPRPPDLAAAVFFYFVLEMGFQVPLLKGPLEAALGLY